MPRQAPPAPTDEKTAKQLQEKKEAKQDLSMHCRFYIVARVKLTIGLSVHAPSCHGHPVPDVRLDGEWSRSTSKPR